jgi:hypothetical protein
MVQVAADLRLHYFGESGLDNISRKNAEGVLRLTLEFMNESLLALDGNCKTRSEKTQALTRIAGGTGDKWGDYSAEQRALLSKPRDRCGHHRCRWCHSERHYLGARGVVAR